MDNRNSCKFIFLMVVRVLLTAGVMNNCSAEQEGAPFGLKPWEVGQYVVYQIISFEGEDAGNRYRISLIGEEEVGGKKYFWEQIDIWENVVTYSGNKVGKNLVKNISFKALVLPADARSFMLNPADFIANGVFPRGALKLSVQINDDPWQDVEADSFFAHQGLIDNTPYSQSPHAKGRIDFTRLNIDRVPQGVDTSLGEISCYHFYVNTDARAPYWDEGFDLWRSPDIPILGLVKMEFSKTLFWEKWKNQNRHTKTIPGRMRPDTCRIYLIDYGPK